MTHPNYSRLSAALLATLVPLAAHAATYRGTVDYVRMIPSVREFTKPKHFFSKLLEWVAGPADDKPELTRPYSTTRDSTGRLLVADPGQRGVHIYDFEKQKYQFLKAPRNKPFQSPIEVVCDAYDSIYVSDSLRGEILVFDVKGKFLRSFGQAGAKETRLQRPTGMALDPRAGRLYVTDTLRHQVMVYGLDGTPIRSIGQRGAGPAEFNFPTGIALSAGRLYVVDAMNFRIQALTPEGQFIGAFGKLGDQTGTLNRPKGIAADTDGNLYVVDALFGAVQVFDPNGQLVYYFGSNGTGPSQFQLPSGISIDSRNAIYVADSYNRRVQVFHYRRRE
jgi:DNA-binding beta-propeller fold protein YncE